MHTLKITGTKARQFSPDPLPRLRFSEATKGETLHIKGGPNVVTAAQKRATPTAPGSFPDRRRSP